MTRHGITQGRPDDLDQGGPLMGRVVLVAFVTALVIAMGTSLLARTPAADPEPGGTIAVFGDTVHTMAGDALSPGVVLVQDGVITAVGTPDAVAVPEGTRVRRARVVTPGLIDARTTLGLTGMLNQRQDQEQLEASAPLQPELRAVDAYNGRDPLVAWMRGFGITTVHTGHGPGALVSGQTMIVKTTSGTVESALVEPFAMVAATLGDGARAPGEGKAPGTRAKAVAMLRQALVDARAYAARRAGDTPGDRDLRLESLAAVLSREVPLMVTAHRHQDILAALRLAEEFDLALVLDGGAEAYSLTAQLVAADVPVIVHPAMTRSGGMADDTANVSYANAALLVEAGVAIAQQSGFEGYVPKVRVALLEAAVAGRYGLPFDDNLASLTIGAARILGVDDRLGSLEVGKHGDLALYDGDPFEYTTRCVGTVIDGHLVAEGER